MSRTKTTSSSVANGQAPPSATDAVMTALSSQSVTDAPIAAEIPNGGFAAPATRDGRQAVVRTTAICALVGAAGHVLLLLGWMSRPPGVDNLLPWQPVVGASLTVVAVVAFGGFYLAALRARIALMSTFILTFLLLLTYVLTVAEMNQGAELQLTQALLDDFRVIVQTIIGFYFGTETILSITKIIRAPKENAAAVRRADRDLPAGAD
jgi:hypothetical protein